ncbi:response regulator transcription factor [Clostridium perfringens]|uniref:response regulator transcription factor n=2 Tax=Clostridium perfringens TaxID=1502 RepID=UPI000B396A83|nr:response regulator [Clostridium perfringens]EHK2400374.1 response regulator [Clostridium perfringens]ELC8434425.1 response regulator [Clostridium perfringens]MBO3328357.1 response regulator [Clostridium perfringens]MDK0784293.1 response regulator [Clostridium perfringens]MDK0844713.1 response regulator [Clostridium perfringens]
MVSIMVADDEQLERSVLIAILKKNLRVKEIIEARNGKEALELNRELNPDIIIMDIKMPGINGIKALELIKKENPNKEIIMLTAYDDFEFIHKVLVLGGSDYILKPIKPDKIMEIVDNIIDKVENKRIELGDKKHIDEKYSDSSLTNEEKIVDKVSKYIDDNMDKMLKLEELASICNLSPGYFSRVFKKETGKTVITYINEKKVERAKKLLKESKDPIINISLDLGFDDCGYFIRVFKKITGLTPKAFREE